MDYSIRIGGEAGQGIQTVGDTLAKVFSRTGYHVFSHQDYESRIRGGHNFYQVRVSDRPVTAPRDRIAILAAFDNQSIELHRAALDEQGIVILDPESISYPSDDPRVLAIPFSALAAEHGGSRIMANTVATGAILGMLGMELGVLLDIISDTFGKKGEDVIKANAVAAHAGYDYAMKHCSRCSFSSSPQTRAKMLISGIEAIGFGALASGCKFYAAYPMTPSTGIMNYLAGKEKEFGIVVEQTEDEIAAINMALGASFAGVRAMTASSGGGFALMVEGLSLAAMTETPLVIGLGQRPGPATGLPTRTEQAELNFALYTAHGEFPRIIFAPGDPEQALYLTNRAFDLAEKFQVTVFILFDTYLADTQWTYEGLDLPRLVYTDYRLRNDSLASLDEYRRHAYTESGVSPLAVPGDSTHVVVTDSDEHTEDGHITEDAGTRKMMVEKRIFRKMPAILKEINPPMVYGDENAEVVLVGWGSTFGVMRESVDILSNSVRIAMLHFSEIYPFPAPDRFDYLTVLRSAQKTICIENNATGQFGRLLKTETGFQCSAQVLKYDGRPFTVESLTGELHGHIG